MHEREEALTEPVDPDFELGCGLHFFDYGDGGGDGTRREEAGFPSVVNCFMCE